MTPSLDPTGVLQEEQGNQETVPSSSQQASPSLVSAPAGAALPLPSLRPPLRRQREQPPPLADVERQIQPQQQQHVSENVEQAQSVPAASGNPRSPTAANVASSAMPVTPDEALSRSQLDETSQDLPLVTRSAAPASQPDLSRAKTSSSSTPKAAEPLPVMQKPVIWPPNAAAVPPTAEPAPAASVHSLATSASAPAAAAEAAAGGLEEKVQSHVGQLLQDDAVAPQAVDDASAQGGDIISDGTITKREQASEMEGEKRDEADTPLVQELRRPSLQARQEVIAFLAI